MYQQINLSDHTPVGAPGPLPSNLVGLPDSAVADISAVCSPPPPGMEGQGWWPVVVLPPVSFDPASQVAVDPVAFTADPTTLTVKGQQTARAMTDDEFVAANPAPPQVTNYQARRALRAAALFDKADAAVRGAGNPSFVDAWDYANVFLREDDVITAMGGALGLSPRAVDDLFRAAARFG